MSEAFLHRCSNSYSSQNRLDDEVRIVERYWSLWVHGQRLPALLELPSIKSVAKPEPYAGMVLQILRMPRQRVGFEVRRGTYNRETQLPGHLDRDHVSLDELAELNPRVVLSSHKVYGVVRRSNLQNDLRIGPNKLGQLWKQHQLRGRSRNNEPNAPCRIFPLLPGFGQRSFDSFQRRREFQKKGASGSGWRDAARGSREQLQP